ncbi:tRNA (N(6)-L-threonylcarbamoyladenosine(37)-C(2))-methylthiotransferase MtaB [Simkania negevensis]|uniref:Putative methylthiotransferase CPn_0477/CP_0277/CPj0477/CpB0496 n=1 Tax=Simkania negevensis (strain ATCC VR-1471 / DSM 27360 / Z) TaxID=331113 RepID=F8L774_SIMNZ|nr:tRNA (N(6)-L-threonylcarbamoyladenosine(37)-C(2))-methylthiotransferase MtaB [Simkania negevensis]CCB88589.1 putative methylthiotransferase CPn_0477/CP_0277/CPj0477/CpB0496 [Simkania negevensis Z]
MKKKKYKVVTLGCRTNQYESQAYIDQLKASGYSEAAETESADVCIVNTCTVTASADKRSLYQIRKLAREHSPERLIVTGCMAERAADEIRAVEGVTDVVPNQRKEALLDEVFPETDWPEFKIERFEAHTRAFVKIQDGCNSYCSYCVIPFVRGRSRSKTVYDILAEIEGLVENGYKEIVLTGINIGDFDGGTPENPVRLSTLVRLVDQIEGLERIRISSIDPDEVEDDLIDAVINGKKTCHSMHIVLQAGSNVTLKRMRRKYTRRDVLDATRRLQRASSDFTFTTDVIVGFPGETEEDFQETVDLIREIRFAKVHMFPYSDRPKTRASRMPNKVAQEVIDKRRQLLLKVADEVAYDLRQSYIGRTFDVLIESKNMGHTNHFLPVYIEEKGLRSNEMIQVECFANSVEGLIGKKVEAHAIAAY